MRRILLACAVMILMIAATTGSVFAAAPELSASVKTKTDSRTISITLKTNKKILKKPRNTGQSSGCITVSMRHRRRP